MLLNPFLLERARKKQVLRKQIHGFNTMIPISTITMFDINLQNMKNEMNYEFKTIKIHNKQNIHEKYDKIKKDLESNVSFLIEEEQVKPSEETPEGTPKSLEEDFVLVDSEEDKVEGGDKVEEKEDKEDVEEDKEDKVEEEDKEGTPDKVDKVVKEKEEVEPIVKEEYEDKEKEGGSKTDENIKTVFFSFF